MPVKFAVPSPLYIKLTPLGREPLSVIAAVGKELVVTVTVFHWPAVKVVDAALVKTAPGLLPPCHRQSGCRWNR